MSEMSLWVCQDWFLRKSSKLCQKSWHKSFPFFTFDILRLYACKDYSGLTKGARLQAEADGKYWAAEVTW